MNADERIQQFKNMAEADPDNELGHFSLGKAYLDADRPADAEPSFQRVLKLNPEHSKAYQLLAEAQVAQGKRDEAIQTLNQGLRVATERGDVMPRDAMAEMLTRLGQPVPEVTVKASPAPAAAPAADAGRFQCSRCGRPSGKLPERPFRGELGEKVWARICSDCWRDWIGMGTKVINELGLQLADPRAQKIYDDHMKDFLQLQD